MSCYAARDSAKFLAETLAVALLYVATAKLGFLFAIAPGNVTVIWPPSGIALAAVLVRGYRASLGIWSGAMLVNLIFFSQDPSLSTLGLIKASSIGTGSLLQALLAGWLYRLAIGFATPVAIKDVIKFVAIAAPSCGVAATVGASTLAYTGAIPWGDYPQTWSTWWLGDLAGILTLTPPLLLLSRRSDRDIARLAFPVISLGCGLSLIAFYSVWHLESQAVATRFERETGNIVFALRRSVAIDLKDLDAIAAFYAASDRVESAVGAPVEHDPTELWHGLHYVTTIQVAGREWLLIGKPSVNYLGKGRTWLPWSTLIAGLLFTALLGAYLHRYAQSEAALRTAQSELEQRVRVKTNALKPVITALGAEIAQRRRIEKQLRTKEAMFRTFLNTTPAMMWMTDSKGHSIFFNNAWLAFTGRTLHEELHLPWTVESIHPEGREACLAIYRQGFHVHTAFQHQYRLQRKDGAYRWIFEIGTPFFDASGRYEGFIGTASDVTERIEVERMKNEFVSVVSHELRTPLTAIRGSLGLLATGSLGRLDDKGTQMLAIAVNNTDRLVRLINDFLDLERMASGRAALDLQICDAAALIGQALELLDPLAVKAGVTISAWVPPHELRADSDRIVQVLTNLLDNAIKFSERGSKVCISTELNQNNLVFCVKDEGRGIPADKLDYIFERFQQVDASDSRQMGGTGLGLAICWNIVKQHGGRIWVESELRHGSRFYFTLPACGAPGDESTATRAEESDLSPPRTEAA